MESHFGIGAKLIWSFFFAVSGFNINYVEDHGDDYDPNMEEFVATNEWQQVKHGMYLVVVPWATSQIYAGQWKLLASSECLVKVELFEIAVNGCSNRTRYN